MDAINTPIIQLNNIRFSWPKSEIPILDIESFVVQKQEKVFIQGASGSGKTTLLGILGGVLLAQSGEAIILETNLNKLSGKQRDNFRVNHIGFIFQMFNLLPYLSVLENVLLPCHFSESRRKQVLQRGNTLAEGASRILKDLGLEDPDLLSRSVNELSIGQQQRVAAARALIGNPDILIADEPTSALDADTRESFLQLLFKECQAFQTTLVFVSHDASLAKLFDRVVKIANQNLQESK